MTRWQLWVAAATSLAGSSLLSSAAPVAPPLGESIALANWQADGRHHRPQPIEIRVSTTGNLYPGARRKVRLTIINPNVFPVKVRMIRGRVKSTSRRGCAPLPTNLEVRPYSSRLPLTVGPRSRRDAGSLDIFMPNSVVDACQRARFIILRRSRCRRGWTMRRGIKVGVFAATVGLGASSTLVAYASWTVPSQGVAGRAVAGNMRQGVTPSAALQDGHAVVSWSAQELRAGVRMQRYTVTAHSVDLTPRPDVAHTVDATGASTESSVFTSSELGGGKWKWAITPRFETWVGAESHLSGKVIFPPPAPAPVLAGAADPARTAQPDAPLSATTPTTTPAPEAGPTSPAAPPATAFSPTPSPVESTSAPAPALPTETPTSTPADP